MEHKFTITVLSLLAVVIILSFIYKNNLLWTGGNQLGCSDCYMIKQYTTTVYGTYTCPTSVSGVDYFAGCIVSTYTTFALSPGETFNVCGSSSSCTATIQYWGKCNPRYLPSVRCNGNVVQKEYKNKDCSISWVNYENCDSKDGCQGTTYYDYYCSNGQCLYKTYPNDPRCAQPKGNINLNFIGAVGGGLAILGLLIYFLIIK